MNVFRIIENFPTLRNFFEDREYDMIFDSESGATE